MAAEAGQASGRLRVALPNKGRLAEPAAELLLDAGIEVELSERRLTAVARNVDIELLFVRTGDITEYVRDGLVDLGVTGKDLVAEQGDGLVELIDLGFGACSLVVAVPARGDIGDIGGLAGKRIATTFPRLTNAFLQDNGVEAQVIEVTGAVEVTPQLGMADAVVDLVASGSTLRVNGLSRMATLLESQAVLVAASEAMAVDPRVTALTSMLRSVVEARGREYMMMNAPTDALDRIRELIPGMSGPTVMPLADPSMMAVHSVVERRDLWHLVPRLQAAGARDILIVPIEKVIR